MTSEVPETPREPENDDQPQLFSWKTLWQTPSTLLILLVKLYQITLGPFLGGRCRFEPSCSRYFIQAVQKYGAIRGAMKGLFRICRCHPFHPGGYDPP